MSDSTIRLIAFSSSVAFSAALLIFSLVMLARDSTSQLYLSIAMTIIGIFIPSPAQLTTYIRPQQQQQQQQPQQTQLNEVISIPTS